MRRVVMAAGACALCATGAMAGGIDRSGQSIAALFEKGDYAELSFGAVNPSVSGLFMGMVGSGNMAPSYQQLGFAFKKQLNDKLSVALIVDQPFGADVGYPEATGYPLGGTTAQLSSKAITAVGRYQLSDRVSAHLGLRYQTMQGEVEIWQGGGPVYGLSVPASGGRGYLFGAAYEIPEIALRLAATYNSTIDMSFDVLEGPNAATLVVPGAFTSTSPESLNIEFQSGVAADTLVFGSIRWVNWPQFDITPPVYYATNTEALVDYQQRTVSYTLGVGRKFSDTWSGSMTLGYEPSLGAPTSNLAPTDGYTSLQLGAQYTRDNMKVSAGVRYVKIGDAVTRVIGGDFTDNSAVALGLKVGFSF